MPACTGPLSCRRWSRCASPRSRSRTGRPLGATRCRPMSSAPSGPSAPARPSRSRCWAWPRRSRIGPPARRATTGSRDLVQQVFEAPEERRRAGGVHGPPRRRPAATATWSDVVATRAGLSTRRIVVLAHRDGPGPGEPLRHRRAARAGARAEVARARQDDRAGLHLRLEQRLRRRAGWARSEAGGAGGRRDRARRHGRHQLRSRGSSPGRDRGVAAARARAHGAGRRAARDPQRCRRPARARPVGPARAADRGLRAGRDRPPRACPRSCSPRPASSGRRPTRPSTAKRLGAFGRAALGAIGRSTAPGRATARRSPTRRTAS